MAAGRGFGTADLRVAERGARQARHATAARYRVLNHTYNGIPASTTSTPHITTSAPAP